MTKEDFQEQARHFHASVVFETAPVAVFTADSGLTISVDCTGYDRSCIDDLTIIQALAGAASMTGKLRRQMVSIDHEPGCNQSSGRCSCGADSQ